ncbi:MAG: hypothetical protein AB7P03_06970 [Kofleriaceae bacterium]
MTELARIARKIELIERIEKPASIAVGAVTAAAYFYFWYLDGWLATYSWIIPFVIAGGGTLFAFSWWAAKLEIKRDVLLDPAAHAELPEARVVAGSESVHSNDRDESDRGDGLE